MWRELLGLERKTNNLVELISPRRSFTDVVLPDATRRQLFEALTQIEKNQLIFTRWGLGERHPTALGLAFNFAGPPGTGKTICAEAVAFTLGRKLLRVRYSELESCWAGETGKNIRAVFREARAQDAVLFFDEADSIAARRFSSVTAGYEREANQSVNILLKELEDYDGVVIFATNMASNFDPAFERRIRTHILFLLPGQSERERIWDAQIHPSRTPLGSDVDFAELSSKYEVSGGDIRNAVLKAAQIAASGEGPDETKRILQKHFVQALDEVLAGKRVMQQNAVGDSGPNPLWVEAMEALEQKADRLESALGETRAELTRTASDQAAAVDECVGRITGFEALLDGRCSELDGRLESGLDSLSGQLGARLEAAQLAAQTDCDSLRSELSQTREAVRELHSVVTAEAERSTAAIASLGSAQESRVVELAKKLSAQSELVARATLIRLPPPAATAVLVVLLMIAAALGFAGGRMAG